jgi:hypothetical protein
MFLFYSPVLAEEDIPTEEIELSTPHYEYKADAFAPALGRYTYDVSWQGIPAARASAVVKKKGDTLKVIIRVRTLKAIDIFYKLRYHAEAVLSASKMTPKHSFFNKNEKSRIRNMDLSFHPDGEISVIRNKNGNIEKFKFNPHNFTLDPFSAAFIARSLDWSVGDTKYFDAYEGQNRYLVALSAAGKEKIKHNGKLYETWVIKPRVKKLGFENEKNKLRDASIYLTTDTARDILLIRSEVFIGSVKTKLTSFKPLQ